MTLLKRDACSVDFDSMLLQNLKKCTHYGFVFLSFFAITLSCKNIFVLLENKICYKHPAMVAEWAKASVLIQGEWHRRSQVQIPLEDI